MKHTRNVRWSGQNRVCIYLTEDGQWFLSRTRQGRESRECGVWTEKVKITEHLARAILGRDTTRIERRMREGAWRKAVLKERYDR